jgi:long-chain acyl-CoA synthetase
VEEPALRTLADLPFYVAGRYPRPRMVGRALEQGIETISTQDLFERIRDLSLGFGALGLAPGERVAIVSESRPEWTITDLAVLAAGGVTVPVYPTLSAAQARQILTDSGARFAVVSTAEQAAKIQQVRHQAPALEGVFVMEQAPALPAGTPLTQSALESMIDASVVALADLAARGHARIVSDRGSAREFEERVASVEPDHLATLIYTSGTTGEPKGVMLTHANIVANIRSTQGLFAIGPDDVALSFLPLSHSFERLVVYLYLSKGVTVIFAESLETVARDIPKVRPTMMTGAPRVYEKLYARVLETGQQATGLKRKIFDRALAVGAARSRRLLQGRQPGVLTRLQYGLFDRLVFSKIRERLGGRVRYLVSGSAPLPVHIGEFFHAAGLLIVEGYGLTETAPVLTVNPPEAPRFGTVGKAVPDVELRLAEDGEILARGPNVMKGYYNKPDATAEVLEDGWFHTGDIGAIDADGYLTITDRKKDLIVTSGGKNVAPQPIETALKQHPLVAEAVLLGDRQRFVSALIAPDFPTLERRLRDLDRPVEDHEALARRPDVRGLYQEIINALNRDLAPYEQIKRFALLPAEFSIGGGELTPTMKVKRGVVEDRWKEAIAELYR